MTSRRKVLYNPNTTTLPAHNLPGEEILSFHKSLDGYKPTRLVRLDTAAQDVGVQAVYVKEESNRFGLPSFKILGASWAIYQLLRDRFKLDQSATFEDVKRVIRGHELCLVAATDGNHGTAVSYVGQLLGLCANIFVPKELDSKIVQCIRDQGATVKVIDGDYDATVQAARAQCNVVKDVFIQDTSFDSYKVIPEMIVAGYSTVVTEADQQLQGHQPDLVVVPAGVGSFAQAVVTHYKSTSNQTKILVVEADTAPCLYESLQADSIVTVQTSNTIMSGLNCGTVSQIAWPILRCGIDAAVMVSDYECHLAIVNLQKSRVSAGPCGAATLAAIRRLSTEDQSRLGLTASSTILILSTEAAREYRVPESGGIDDLVLLP